MRYFKYLYCIFLIICLFPFCKENDPIDICLGFENKVYNYSIYNCAGADSLDCYQKRLKSALLPEQYLKCSSTDNLTRTCLNYPFLPNIWLYNSIQQGFDHVMDIFNGFHTLFTRPDANIALIEVYQEMDPKDVYNFTEPADRGAYMTQFTFIEITISQFLLINRLTHEETKTLVATCLDKYYYKSKIPSYTWIGEMSGLAIMARVLYSINYKPFNDKLISIPNLSFFIESADFGGFNNIEELTQFIVTNAENFLNDAK